MKASSASTVGGGVFVTVTVRVVEFVAPSSSRTVSPTVYVPAVAYVRLAVTPVPVVPSPKVHS